MWHHKTRFGTFWIVQAEDSQAYYLGMEEESLGHYQRIEEAISDIHRRETGYLIWDMTKDITVPPDLTQWQEGEPECWESVQ